MNRFFALYLRAVTEYPRGVLGVLFVLLLFFMLGLPNFKLDASADSLTLENDTDLDYFRQTAKRYDSGDFLVVTFKPKQDLFSDASLALLGELKRDLEQVEGIASINSILEVPLLYSPIQSLTEMAKNPRTLLTDGVDRSLAKKEFLESPLYKNLILGPDGQTTAMQLTLRVDTTYLSLVSERDRLQKEKKEGTISQEDRLRLEQVSTEFNDYRTQADERSRQRVQHVRDIVASYKDEAQIFVGGVTMIAADMIAFIQSDLVVFGSAVIAFMILVLAIIFRSVKFVVIPMLSCLTAVLIMLGYVSWLDWRLTVISSNFVALLLIISLSIIIHLVVRFREYEQENPEWSREQLVIATVKYMARPCFYTAVTTVVAFVSLVVSDIRPVIDFGWMMTMGLILALCLAFLILPSCLVILPRSQQKSVEKKKRSKAFTLYFSHLVEYFGTTIVVVSIAILLLSIWGISRLKVENKFVDYFHQSTEIYQGLTVIDKNLGGTISLDILIDKNNQSAFVDASDTEGNVTDDGINEGESQQAAGDFESFDDFDLPDELVEEDEFAFDSFSEDDESSTPSYWMTIAGLRQIEWLHDYLETQDEIGKVQSLATLYKVGRDINGSLNDFELALMQKTLSDEVRDVLISPYLSPDGTQARVSLRIIDTYPNLERAELVERIKAKIEQEGVFVDNETRFSGLLVLYNNMLQSLFSSQILTLGVVFLAIYVMLVILFKSFVIGIVAIVPNVTAALSVLGLMGLMGIPLDMMTITIAAITVGIGVDDTIHYLHRFKTELAKDGDYIATMHRSHASIGSAMYYTTVIIIFGFGIMVLSRFIPTIYFGLLTGFAMSAALMGALLLLPKLIVWSKPFGGKTADA